MVLVDEFSEGFLVVSGLVLLINPIIKPFILVKPNQSLEFYYQMMMKLKHCLIHEVPIQSYMQVLQDFNEKDKDKI